MMEIAAKPRIDVYTVCWNEQRILPFFLRHYGPLVQKIVLYDNHSTDASQAIAAAHARTEVRRFGSATDQCGELERMAIRQTAWQESRGHADWVIVVDCDEFLWHPNLFEYLRDCWQRQITIPRPTGYEMVAQQFPDGAGQIYDQVRTGLRASHMDKWLLFDPDAIESMNYEPGCHIAHPSGRAVYDDNPHLRLLHFKRLGHDYTIARFHDLERRRTAQDRELGLNQHYTETDEALDRWLCEAQGHAIDVLHMGG
jgi:Glycosyl transferase family 2